MGEIMRVGVIGANPTRGWALRTHLPALRALPGVELIAVATTRAESAKETARAFAVPHAFGDAAELIAEPDVDVVAVCVKVPDHYRLVRAALDAGKHVFCEWPLAANTEQASELADRAAELGVANVVGLQGRMSPKANYLRDLVRDGYVGEVLSVSLSQRSSGRGGREVHVDELWEADRDNGATLLRITAGHSVDLLRYCVGEPDVLASTVATRYPTATVAGTKEQVTVTSPDIILVEGRLRSGAFVTIDVQGGFSTGGVRLEVHGTKGSLRLDGASNLQMNDGPLHLLGSQGGAAPEPLEVPASYVVVPDGVPAGTARNTAGLYLALAAAVAGNDTPGPTFADALSLHRLLDEIEGATAAPYARRTPN